MDQYEQIQTYNKKFFLELAIKIALAAGVIIGGSAIVGLAWYYQDLNERKIGLDDAKKIGNWDLPDNYYVFEGAYKIKMYDGVVRNVEITDEKSANEIYLLEMSKDFADKHLKYDSVKNEEEKNNDELFLELYTPDNYAEKAAGKIEDGNAEIYYNLIENKGYKALDERIKGFLGRMDCGDEVIIILATNKEDDYDNDRVLGFAKTLKCDSRDEKNEKDAMDKNINSGQNPEKENISSADDIKEEKNNSDKNSVNNELENGSGAKENSGGANIDKNNNGSFDSDGDGLSDNVEYIISTDPNKVDTDGDGFSDFDEIKSGYNPQIHSPGDELPPIYYEKIKEDIKNIDEENYNTIFNSEN